MRQTRCGQGDVGAADATPFASTAMSRASVHPHCPIIALRPRIASAACASQLHSCERVNGLRNTGSNAATERNVAEELKMGNVDLHAQGTLIRGRRPQSMLCVGDTRTRVQAGIPGWAATESAVFRGHCHGCRHETAAPITPCLHTKTHTHTKTVAAESTNGWHLP